MQTWRLGQGDHRLTGQILSKTKTHLLLLSVSSVHCCLGWKNSIPFEVLTERHCPELSKGLWRTIPQSWGSWAAAVKCLLAQVLSRNNQHLSSVGPFYSCALWSKMVHCLAYSVRSLTIRFLVPLKRTVKWQIVFYCDEIVLTLRVPGISLGERPFSNDTGVQMRLPVFISCF